MRSSTLGQFGFNLFWFPWRASQCVSHGASPFVFHEPANPLREILLLLAQFRIVRIGLELLIHLPQHSFQLRPHGTQPFPRHPGPSNRISPVLESMMMSSGWGIGSGPVAPLRARSARTWPQCSLYSTADLRSSIVAISRSASD